MKNLIFIFFGLLLLYFSNIKVVAQERTTHENTISVLSTPDLYNLTNDWAHEFCRLYPGTNIKVIKFTDGGLSDISDAGGKLCFVSNEKYATHTNNKLWKMELGKDALVPIINSKNPFLTQIKEQNISPEILAQILVNPKNRQWKVFPGVGQGANINYYMVNNQDDKSKIADFLSSGHGIEGIIVDNYDKMISAIQNDPYSIGFCKLSNLIRSNDPNIYQSITIMPVDKNGNGIIDDFENDYCDLQTFMNRMWIGKFPEELTGNIFSIASQTPSNQTELAFLKWITTDGQKYLNQKGYSMLVSDEKQSNLTILAKKDYIQVSNDSSVFASVKEFFASISLSLYVFAIFIISLIVIVALMAKYSKNEADDEKAAILNRVFDENSISVPTGLFFDKTHTWAFMEKNGMVRIGIDDFLQHITGPLTKVKMKNPGENVKKGEPVLSVIQNGKLLNINSPVSGTIVKQNEALSTDPSAINQSPYSNGWVYMIEPTNWLREIKFFTMTEKYREWIKNEFSRLKDFLSVTLNAKMPGYVHVVLQDGGVIKDNVLADLGPEVWEEFQTNFIDTMK